MPPFPGIPYGAAPAWCFPLTELCMYALFILCLRHALKQGLSHVCYLLGGLLFGLMLEYINVHSNMGYTYGKFMVMFGNAPQDIPLCIGVGWGIIMYSARLFTDVFGLPWWVAAAADTLLAINIDLGMDTVAYRLHMWHWDWSDTNLNPLTADWFGIPYGNFFGWLMVVFFYASSYRLLEKLVKQKARGRMLKTIFVPLLSVIISQIALYAMLVYVDEFLYEQFGITSLHRFVAFLVVLLVIGGIGWRRRNVQQITSLPLAAWLVPAWFHLFFFGLLFMEGFYLETLWLAIIACVNIFIGAALHLAPVRVKSKIVFTTVATATA